MDTPPPTTTPKVVDNVNAHLVDYVNVTPSHLVDSVNADTPRSTASPTTPATGYRVTCLCPATPSCL